MSWFVLTKITHLYNTSIKQIDVCATIQQLVGSMYPLALNELQENVSWWFFEVLGLENNISKDGQNQTTRKGLNLTSQQEVISHVCIKYV